VRFPPHTGDSPDLDPIYDLRVKLELETETREDLVRVFPVPGSPLSIVITDIKRTARLEYPIKIAQRVGQDFSAELGQHLDTCYEIKRIGGEEVESPCGQMIYARVVRPDREFRRLDGIVAEFYRKVTVIEMLEAV
jgi:hypothetical protein